MPRFFRHKKTGKVISEEEYKAQLLENTEVDTLDKAMTGMDALDDTNNDTQADVFEDYGDYEEYFEEDNK
ncbi:hypothetical protein ACYSNU_18140 [Enterococcus sp. LJL120]